MAGQLRVLPPRAGRRGFALDGLPPRSQNNLYARYGFPKRPFRRLRQIMQKFDPGTPTARLHLPPAPQWGPISAGADPAGVAAVISLSQVFALLANPPASPPPPDSRFQLVLTALAAALRAVDRLPADMLLLRRSVAMPVCRQHLWTPMVPALWAWPLYVLAAGAVHTVDLIAVAIWGPDPGSNVGSCCLHNLLRQFPIKKRCYSPHRAMCSAWWWWRSCSARSLERRLPPPGFADLDGEPGPIHCPPPTPPPRAVACCAAIALPAGSGGGAASPCDFWVSLSPASVAGLLGSVFSGPDLRLLISVVCSPAYCCCIPPPQAFLFADRPIRLLGRTGPHGPAQNPRPVFVSAPSPPSAATPTALPGVSRWHPPGGARPSTAAVLRLLEEIESGPRSARCC